jgi:hypothetical protein
MPQGCGASAREIGSRAADKPLEDRVGLDGNAIRPQHVPALRYRDLNAAVDWLCKAFGFEKRSVVTAGDGSVLYTLLTFRNAMLMLLPVRESALDGLMKQPDEIGGAETQSSYFVVDDADAQRIMRVPRSPAPTSFSRSRTSSTAGVATRAAIPRATSGASEPSTRGRASPCRRPRGTLPRAA